MRPATGEDYVDSLAARFGLLECEARHAKENLECAYEGEAAVKIVGGRRLVTPAYPDGCEYVRITFGGVELAYWTADEWRDDPTDVMGALVGAMGGKRPMPLPDEAAA